MWTDARVCFMAAAMERTRKVVFAELCDMVEEMIDLHKQDGKPLPPPTSGKDLAQKMLNAA